MISVSSVNDPAPPVSPPRSGAPYLPHLADVGLLLLPLILFLSLLLPLILFLSLLLPLILFLRCHSERSEELLPRPIVTSHTKVTSSPTDGLAPGPCEHSGSQTNCRVPRPNLSLVRAGLLILPLILFLSLPLPLILFLRCHSERSEEPLPRPIVTSHTKVTSSPTDGLARGPGEHSGSQTNCRVPRPNPSLVRTGLLLLPLILFLSLPLPLILFLRCHSERSEEPLPRSIVTSHTKVTSSPTDGLARGPGEHSGSQTNCRVPRPNLSLVRTGLLLLPLILFLSLPLPLILFLRCHSERSEEPLPRSIVTSHTKVTSSPTDGLAPGPCEHSGSQTNCRVPRPNLSLVRAGLLILPLSFRREAMGSEHLPAITTATSHGGGFSPPLPIKKKRGGVFLRPARLTLL